MWQYTSKGSVLGIKGNVDMSCWYTAEEKGGTTVAAQDVIGVMRGWIGKSRSAGTHHDIIDLYNSYTPRARGYKVKYSDEYCDPALTAALTRLDAISRQLQISAQQLTVLMNGLNRSVPGVMNNVNGITNNLTGATGNLTDLSESLKNMPLDETMNKLNTTLANLQALSEQLNDKNSSLGKVINDRELYDNANHAIASLDSLLTDIKAHPKRYINVKVF